MWIANPPRKPGATRHQGALHDNADTTAVAWPVREPVPERGATAGSDPAPRLCEACWPRPRAIPDPRRRFTSSAFRSVPTQSAPGHVPARDSDSARCMWGSRPCASIDSGDIDTRLTISPKIASLRPRYTDTDRQADSHTSSSKVGNLTPTIPSKRMLIILSGPP